MIMDGGNMDRHISDQTAEEAGLWDARLRAPDCTDDDRARFAQWRDADSSHFAAFERLQTIVASLRSEMSRADVRALRDAALRAGPRHQWRLSLLVAASLATLTLVTAVWTELAAAALLLFLIDVALRRGLTMPRQRRAQSAALSRAAA